ncbi:hypothetical protein HYT32_01840 [Candidatus Roizmanbacteria bacterium]|nr:hypothetical protein [Candidatus Roizmanbacteria bacterium]
MFLERPKNIKPASEQKPEVTKPQPSDEQSGKLLDTISSLKGQDPDRTLKEVAGFRDASLMVDLSSENVSKVRTLRDPALVGKDKYGEGLVNKYQKGKNTPSEHEKAQAIAYKDLQQKIDQKLVEPSIIGAEIVLKLGVSRELGDIPQTYSEIVERVSDEAKVFLEKGDITKGEFETITQEITEFSNLYSNAYGTENIAKTFELVRDNERKMIYQHVVDKSVFSGSDHGLRHIVNGNIRFAKQMVESLRGKGVVVSAKDEVIIHQVMIDHDLGYTTGAARAPKGWEASKDHPLVSARFIEDNKTYYVNKFGEDGYQAIHDSVLNHSYPKLEYQSDGKEVVHKGLIRGISSTVDSLGVTVETKTPEFFWSKDAMRTLLKIRLAMETMGGKVPEELMGRYKQELMGVAGQEQNPDRRSGYENAIDNFFNEFTAENTLGHYTGIVRNVYVEKVSGLQSQETLGNKDDHGHEGENTRFRVVVEMTPTEVYALLGNMFGDKLASQSFVKAIKDLELDPKQVEAHARAIRGARSRGEKKEVLEVASDRARIIVGSEFLEEQGLDRISDVLDAQKIQTISEVFHEIETLSIRTEINELLDDMSERGVEAIPEIQARFERSISSKTTLEELRQLNDLLINLSDMSLTGEKDANGNDITVSQAARERLKGFLTTREKDFLGV